MTHSRKTPSSRDVRYYALLAAILAIGLLAWRVSLPWMVRSEWIEPAGIIFANRWKLAVEWAATLSLAVSLACYAWAAMCRPGTASATGHSS